MRIAFVIKTLASQGGGAERVLTQVIHGLVRRGHDLTLVSFGSRDDPDFYPVDPAVRRLWLGLGDVRARSGAWEVLTRAAALRRIIREVQPDVAVGFMHSAYVPLALALSTSPTPVLASEHILYDHYRTLPLEAFALRATAPFYAAMTVISEAIRMSFPPALRKRMEAIPNPVARVARLANPVGGPSKVVLNVGRLFDQKDQRTLIEAFAKVAGDYPDWVLRIVGEGPLRPALEKLVQDRCIGDRVQLPGVIDDIDHEYEAAQILVMSSRYESFGLATAEGLAHGLPVIGFADCAGTNELIRNNHNGLLVPSGDRIDGLAAALRQLMQDAELRRRLGAAGPPSVTHFSLDVIVSRWEGLLRRCIEKGRHK
jgi:glycosyltransferase involved in cell wall biosynthesis